MRRKAGTKLGMTLSGHLEDKKRSIEDNQTRRKGTFEDMECVLTSEVL